MCASGFERSYRSAAFSAAACALRAQAAAENTAFRSRQRVTALTNHRNPNAFSETLTTYRTPKYHTLRKLIQPAQRVVKCRKTAWKRAVRSARACGAEVVVECGESISDLL